MGQRDPRVDAYIAKQADFARPIIARFREIVHEADPETTEDIKWGAPAFMHNGIVCIIAGFKQHCAGNFWRRGLIVGTRARRATDDKEMEKFSRMTSVADLPSKATITRYVKLSVQLNAGGVSPSKRPVKAVAKKKTPVRTPPSLAKALARNAKAKA